MKNELSFGSINILTDNIAEIIVNPDVVISMEMVEEFETLLANIFPDAFGLLINKVHRYSFAFEAKLSIGSHANLKAIAVVNYSKKSELTTDDIANTRKRDGWNLKSFSGLELGWQSGFDWLKKELSANN